jgi:hypothetical protein
MSRPFHKLTPDKIAEALRRRRAGDRVAVLARELGVAPATLHAHFARALANSKPPLANRIVPPVPVSRAPALTDEKLEEIHMSLLHGLAPAAIARMAGVPLETVLGLEKEVVAEQCAEDAV